MADLMDHAFTCGKDKDNGEGEAKLTILDPVDFH